MKAVILAAGRGTRMGALTEELPKPMLRVWGKPILEHIVEGLIDVGVREFFIITGHRAEVIEDYFSDGSRWGVRISFGRQQVQDGTGRAPELASTFVGSDDFLLSYGDILVQPQSYRRMIERFTEATFSGLITVTRGLDFRKYGLVLFDSAFCLQRIVEKPSAEKLEELRRTGQVKPGDPAWYNAGIYVFKPLLFEFTPRLQKSPRGEYELTDALTALREAGHRIAGLEIPGRWVDVRDPEVLRELEAGMGLSSDSRPPG